MDRDGASVVNTVKMIREKLKARPLLLQLPVGSASEFEGIVDVLHAKQVTWNKV